MKKILVSQINFILAVTCIGSAALFSMSIIMNASEMENPIVNSMVASGLVDE